MKSNHTQEPWKVERVIGSFYDGWEVHLIPETGPDCDWHGFVQAFGFGDEEYREIAEANARRIVACVNACAGIENPADFRAAILKEAADKAVETAKQFKIAVLNQGVWAEHKLSPQALDDLRAAIEGKE